MSEEAESFLDELLTWRELGYNMTSRRDDYDRAWGPERPIFGKVRYMSSDSTRRKLDATAYVEEFGAARQKRLPLE